MNEKFIETLTFGKLKELILEAKSQVIICSANLHLQISKVLSDAVKKGVDIKVILDPSEDNYRNGFGDIKSIDILEKSGITVLEVKGNQISFIVVDNIGFIYFAQSKIFIDDPVGPNALKMDDIFRQKIISYYFPPKTPQEKAEFENILTDLFVSSKKELSSIADSVRNDLIEFTPNQLDRHKLNDVIKNLESNPPIQPDTKRKINTYTAKVQFVEIKFVGAKFLTKKIIIPPEALPYKDASIKKNLETRLKLFTKTEDNSDIHKIEEINNKLNDLKLHFKSGNDSSETNSPDVFLIPITCRPGKSIIDVSRKSKFKDKLGTIDIEIKNYKKGTLENLEKEILKQKKFIKSELLVFLKENPPLEYLNFSQLLFNDKIEDKSQQIIAKIKFPEVSDLVSNIELIYNFYDLTLEDFKDDKLIEEFRIKGILNEEELNEIVSFKDAFAAKE